LTQGLDEKESESTGRYYIGQTHDLEQRLKQHNEHSFSGSTATKRLKGPWNLVYFEIFAYRADAVS